jgi:hypothetical protein
MELIKLDDNVFYYKGVIEDPKSFVDLINNTEEMNGIHEVWNPWSEWSACSGEMYIYGQQKQMWTLKKEDIEAKVSDQKDREIIEKISTTILDGQRRVCEDYALKKNIQDPIILMQEVGVKRYMAGTFMGTHFDQQEGDTRLKYSLVMYLNDDYEGGEISFTVRDGILTSTDFSAREDYDHEINKEILTFAVKPEAGSCLIFPSNPPYSHTAHIIKSGMKYISTGFWMDKSYLPENG